jgi:hypothetical protein
MKSPIFQAAPKFGCCRKNVNHEGLRHGEFLPIRPGRAGGTMAGKRKFSERHERSFVTPFEIKGSMIKGGERYNEVLLIWNISDSGLCIWTESRFKKGENIILEITSPWQVSFDCEVRWSRTIPDRSGYVYGVCVNSSQKDLEKIHKELAAHQKKAI